MSQSEKIKVEDDGVVIGQTKHLFVKPTFGVLKKVKKTGIIIEGKTKEEWKKTAEDLMQRLLDDDTMEEKWNQYTIIIFGKKIDEVSLDVLKPSEVAEIIGNFTVSDSPQASPKDGQ